MIYFLLSVAVMNKRQIMIKIQSKLVGNPTSSDEFAQPKQHEGILL
jgi:hypothetical protein